MGGDGDWRGEGREGEGELGGRGERVGGRGRGDGGGRWRGEMERGGYESGGEGRGWSIIF